MDIKIDFVYLTCGIQQSIKMRYYQAYGIEWFKKEEKAFLVKLSSSMSIYTKVLSNLK